MTEPLTREQFWACCDAQRHHDAQWTHREQVWKQIEDERATLRQQLATVTQGLLNKVTAAYAVTVDDVPLDPAIIGKSLVNQQTEINMLTTQLDAALTQLATARQGVWEEVAKEMESRFDPSWANSLTIAEFVIWCREQARKEQP